MSEPIRIFLVDDHTVLRSGLRMLLNAEPDMVVIGEAGDIIQATDMIGLEQPDVVLLDVSMPKINGLEGLSILQQKSPQSRFLMLTMHDDEHYLRQALAQGASGYVLKQSANEELLSAIRVVFFGGTYLHQEHREMFFEEGGQQVEPSRADKTLLNKLSPREGEILVLIAMGFTNRQAAEKLYLSEKTIETYKSRLMTKLGLHSRADLVRYALHCGLIKS